MSRVSASVAVTIAAPSTNPTWLQTAIAAGVGLNRWYQIPGTAMSTAMNGYTSPGPYTNKPGILAYSGGGFKRATSEIFVMGGGHTGNYSGNEVVRCSLAANAPAWSVPRLPSSPAGQAPNARASDGRPTTRHEFGMNMFVDARNRYFCFGGRALDGDGGATTPIVEAYNPSSNDWDHVLGTDYPNMPGGGVLQNVPTPIVKDGSENVWIITNQFSVGRWNIADSTWTTMPNLNNPPVYATCAAYDPVRSRIVVFSNTNGGWFNPSTYQSNPVYTPISFGSVPGYPWAHYVTEVGAFLMMAANSGTVYRIDPVTYAQTTYSISSPNGAPGASPGTSNFVGGRFFYDSILKLIGYVQDTVSNIWICRLA